MRGFTPLKRNCPICNGTRSDCRQSQETGIIHCRANPSSLPTGWKFIKDDTVANNYKYILDRSAPGLGKSHSAGIALPAAFNSEKLWYISNDHRNPTTSVIQSNYADLCESQKLTIYSRSDRHTALTRAAKFNIFLDATITRERLALLLGIDPEEIYVIEQER
jgi:hypothetical protein